MTGYGYVPQDNAAASGRTAPGGVPWPAPRGYPPQAPPGRALPAAPSFGPGTAPPAPFQDKPPLPVDKERIVLRQWSTPSGLVILVVPSLVGLLAIWGGVVALIADGGGRAQSIYFFVIEGLLVLVGCVLLSMRSILGPEGIELRTLFGSRTVPWPSAREGLTVGTRARGKASLVRCSAWLNVITPHGKPVRLTGLEWMGPSVPPLTRRAHAEGDRIWAWAWARGYIQSARPARAPEPRGAIRGPSWPVDAEGGAARAPLRFADEYGAALEESRAVQAERERREKASERGAAAGAQAGPAPGGGSAATAPRATAPHPWRPAPRRVVDPLPLDKDRIVLPRWSPPIALRKIAVMAGLTLPAMWWGVRLWSASGSSWGAILLVGAGSLLLARTCVRATGRTVLDSRGIAVRTLISSRRWPWPRSRTGLYADQDTMPRPSVAGSRLVLVRSDGDPKPLPGTDVHDGELGYEAAERGAVEQADRIWAWACARGYTIESGEYTYLNNSIYDLEQSLRNRQERRHGLTAGDHPPRP